MDQILNLDSFRLGNGDLLQSFGTLKFLNSEDPELLKLITNLRVGYELYSRVSSKKDIDACQALCYAAIADYMKKHPHASEKDITAEVVKQVEIFKARIQDL